MRLSIVRRFTAGSTMSTSGKIYRIGGVPEHFNIPIHLALENRLFAPIEDKYGLSISFEQIPEGSGLMLSRLQDRSLDLALVLTDALAKHSLHAHTLLSSQVQPPPSDSASLRFLSEYTVSPLTWGIFAHADTQFDPKLFSQPSQKKLRFGISRSGSGSHTMAALLARDHWDVADPDFVVCNNIFGLLSAIENKLIDFFLWEKYITLPYTRKDTHDLPVICYGEIPTRWPAFSFACHPSKQENNTDDSLITTCELDVHRNIVRVILNQACPLFVENQNDASVQRVMDQYNMPREDAEAWFHALAYKRDPDFAFPAEMLSTAVATLVHSGQLPEPAMQLIHKLAL